MLESPGIHQLCAMQTKLYAIQTKLCAMQRKLCAMQMKFKGVEYINMFIYRYICKTPTNHRYTIATL